MTLSPDAASKGVFQYRSWFHFGIRGLKKGAYLKLAITNLCSTRPFASQTYKPVWRSLPLQSEWQRLSTETFFESSGNGNFKFSWTFEAFASENDYYFAYSNPYPFYEINKNTGIFEKMCPKDSIFHRETLTHSLDGREIELITISHNSNFSTEREEKLPFLFPASSSRYFKAKRPIIFISARVHPGETPASFLLDAILQVILSPDARGYALRSNFVFKIIPVLNPDGVYRGNFRVDQNGINLNRCYSDPSFHSHPSIFAVKNYFLYSFMIY